MKVLACLLVILPTLFSTSYASSADAALEKRAEVMASRKYERQCRRNFDPEKQQTAAALTGQEPKVICKLPAVFPERCLSKAANREYVKVAYDVTPSGLVENIRIVEASNDCFVSAAAHTVFMYKYEETPNGAQGLVETLNFYFQR